MPIAPPQLRPLAGALALVAATAFVYGEDGEAAGPRPRMEVVSSSVDLGTIPEGQEAVAEFELRNSGDALLAVLSAKPS
ncbi:MAG: DUF1573 domain-containing protein [Acidobacteriota bacterium]|nr:DUF1573 domain-containing protein [Acidobacteriota bacterium]